MIKKHGMSGTRFYTIWRGIKLRCYNEKRKDFKDYGAKGIKVCDEWQEFINFKNDMYESYLQHVAEYGEKETTLDRITSSGNYEAKNCRWATLKEQARNKKWKKVREKKKKTKKIIKIKITKKKRKSPMKIFIAIDPKGRKHYSNYAKEFAKQNDLTTSRIRECLNGKYPNTKGWQFYFLE